MRDKVKNGWNQIKLGEVAEIILGGTPKTSIPRYWDGDIPWLSVKDMVDSKYIYETERTITELGVKESNTKLMAKGTIIISARGSVGKVVRLGRDMAFNQSCYAIKPIEKIDDDFLFYYLKYSYSFLNTVSHGAVFNTIITDTLKNFEIELPPLPTQRKIASILSAYDDLIENNTRRIQILEEMAQAIYKEWFVHFRFPGYEKVKMVGSELGLIPEGWQVKRLGEVCDIVMGQSPKSEFYNTTGQGLPFHQGVKDFGTRFPTHITYCTVDQRIAEKGDILLSVRAPVGRLNIANTKLIIGRGLSAIRHKELLQSFLFYQLRNVFSVEDSMGSGAIFNAVTKEDITNVKLLVPGNSIDNKFNEIVSTIDNQIENLQSQIENLRRTRDLLLPKLISGEIDIEELDIITGTENGL